MTERARRRAQRGGTVLGMVLLALCTAALPGRARAQDQPDQAAPGAPPPGLAWLDLTVNDLARGPTLVQLGDGDVWVAGAELERAGLAAAGGTRREVEGRTLVSLRSLAPGIQFVLDEEQLELRVAATSAALGRKTLDLNSRARPAGLSPQEITSGFLNLGARVEGWDRLTGTGELGLASGVWSLLTSSSWGSEHGFQRGLTVVRRDDPARQLRTSAGELFAASTDPLGGTALLLGASVGTEPSLDPYLVRDPYPRTSVFVPTPSTLEVWVGDTLVRRTQVAPGTVDLENLPLESGVNEVRTVLRDAFGREQSASAYFLMGSNLLAPGLADWGGAAGVVRTSDLDGRVHYGDAVALAHYRRGMSRLLTLGVRAEGGAALLNGGASLGLATAAGDFEAGAAASRAGEGGGAAYLSWRYRPARRVSLAAQVRWTSAAYATASLDPAANRTLLRALVAASVSPAPRLSLLGELSAFRERDTGDGWRAALRAAFGIARGQQLAANLSAVSRSGQALGWEAFVTWSAQLPRANSVEVGARRSAGGSTAWAAASRGLGVGPGVGYRVEARGGAERLAALELQGQTGFGWAALRERWAGASAGPWARSDVLELATGLVMIDGGLYATRPVEGSYALVVLDGAPGVRVTRDGQVIGRTDRNGKLLVPGLLPYYGNRLGIRDADVPLGFRVNEVERYVAPRFQAGTVERLDVGPARVVAGKVVLGSGEGGEDVPPEWGEIAVGDAVSPIGTDGSFWLEGLSPGRHEAIVRWKGERCTFPLEVPQAGGVAQLGVQRCTPPGAQ